MTLQLASLHDVRRFQQLLTFDQRRTWQTRTDQEDSIEKKE